VELLGDLLVEELLTLGDLFPNWLPLTVGEFPPGIFPLAPGAVTFTLLFELDEYPLLVGVFGVPGVFGEAFVPP
jgi:hypothetical protein